MPQAPRQPEDPSAGGVRELRLAVVLYGGVSLAIYMHGTTKELHRLVKASALEDRAGEDGGGTPSERIYRELLRDLRRRDPGRVRTRVVVDVIAGTSAGGINGIYLAKALAHNRSQDDLRDVWLNRGDISELLRGWRRIPWRIRVPGRLVRARTTPPLDGDAMSRWLYEAADAMDARPTSPPDLETLMPDGHELELFVTATDFEGYDRELVIGNPPLVHDQAHRHVLMFRRREDRDDFGPEDNGWLAFSARATSSFPGAFGPVSPGRFADTVRPAHGMGKPNRFFRIYELSDAAADKRFFVDGGVLDNRPFGHVVRAIRARPAGVQVDRRLIYLEPHPAGPAAAGKGDEPSPIATVLGSVAGIPRNQPILDEIVEIGQHNERVRRLRDIIEASFGPIGARVEEVIGIGLDELVGAPTREDLTRWSDALNREAQAATGASYPTYLRSKISAVVTRYARSICEVSDYPHDCNQAAFVRSVLRAWARQRLFSEVGGNGAPDPRHVDFLRTFDLDYGARRLRFVVDGLSWWYEPADGVPAPPREALDRGKAVLYEQRAVLDGAMSGRDLGTDLTELVKACFEQRRIDEWPEPPERYAIEHAEELMALERALAAALEARLANFGADLFAAVLDVAADWSGLLRRDLLIRYLGFPLWDAILFPVQSVAEAGERDTVEITRFSPDDVRLLPSAEKQKLAGMGMWHFGAFFERSGRERDYLWGRLDGAERLIRILVGDGGGEDEVSGWCRRAFAAILEEEGDLRHVEPVAAGVRAFVAGGPAAAQAPAPAA